MKTAAANNTHVHRRTNKNPLTVTFHCHSGAGDFALRLSSIFLLLLLLIFWPTPSRVAAEFDSAVVNETQELNPSRLVFEGTVLRVGKPPRVLCGVVSPYRLAEYQVERVYEGQYDKREIVVDHLFCSSDVLADIKPGDKVLVDVDIRKKIIERSNDGEIRRDSDTVNTFYVARLVTPANGVAASQLITKTTAKPSDNYQVLTAGGARSRAVRATSLQFPPSDEPAVYIEFERAGAREPLFARQSSSGIWLRLHNNSKKSIVLDMHGVPSDDYGDAALIYDVLSGGRVVIPDSCHVCSFNSLGPSRSLLFSLPAEHLSTGRSIRIKFSYSQEDSKKSNTEPELQRYIYFHSSQLP